MCDSQRGVYMDVGSDEHTASAIPEFCDSSIIDVNNRKKERVREKERERERSGGKEKRENFLRSFLLLIATICRNLPLVNNRITKIASFFDPAQILSKS